MKAGGEDWLAGLKARFAPQLGDRLEICPPEFDAAKLARHYGALDIFCYPSLAEQGETFGVAVAEAMAAGCTPIVSGLACFHELVREGSTGLVFDHTAPSAESDLANLIARLLIDEGERHRLAANAQAHAHPFDYPVVASTLLAQLKHAMKG